MYTRPIFGDEVIFDHIGEIGDTIGGLTAPVIGLLNAVLLYLTLREQFEFNEKQLEDPEFKAEWEALQPELSLVQAMIDARKVSGLTQKELSERTGIAQADISKLENGNANPSLRTLQRLAAGMGMQVKIEFIPAPAK